MSSASAITSRQSAFQKLSSYAKEHHASVNAAYSIYYSPGVSTRPSLETQNSETSQTSSKSTSSVGKAWSSLKKHAKEHHESMNAAYRAYYGAGASAPVSTTPSVTSSVKDSPRASVGDERDQSEGGLKKSWEKVKKAVREHHESVSSAYETYYGGSAVRA